MSSQNTCYTILVFSVLKVKRKLSPRTDMVCGSLDQNAWANYEGAAKFLESTRLRDGRVRAWCLSSEYLTTDAEWDTGNREPWRAGATSLCCFWRAVRRHLFKGKMKQQRRQLEKGPGHTGEPGWGRSTDCAGPVRSPACRVRGVGGSGGKVGCRAGEG